MNKRILFSVFCKTQLQLNIVERLIEILLTKENSIDILSNQKLNISNKKLRVQFFNTIPEVNYDVIIAFNLNGYKLIRDYRKESNIPLIYTLCNSDIEKEYLYEPNFFEHVLLINDSQNFYPNLFPFEYTTNIAFPFELVNNNDNIFDNKNSNILVCVDNATLLNILPVLNNHGEFHFKVISENPIYIKKMVNDNIDVVKVNKNQLDEYIKNSKVVIGSGEFILRSLQFEKPSIVVGKFGFGRVVSLENINQHFYSFFQGRVGAQSGEIIPFDLLSYEIMKLMSKCEIRKNETKQLSAFLKEQYLMTADIIERQINAVISASNTRNIKLKLSSLYYYIEYNQDSYVAIDSRIMKIHSLISLDEYQKIKLFENARTPQSVLKKTGNEDQDKYKKFIEKMKANKILLPYEK